MTVYSLVTPPFPNTPAFPSGPAAEAGGEGHLVYKAANKLQLMDANHALLKLGIPLLSTS